MNKKSKEHEFWTLYKEFNQSVNNLCLIKGFIFITISNWSRDQKYGPPFELGNNFDKFEVNAKIKELMLVFESSVTPIFIK
jgi:hypothetical protein